jgi:Tfp pilus assembly protein PilF
MKTTLTLMLVAGLLALTGCASSPLAQAPQRLFKDALFAPAPVPVTAQSIFELSPQMQRYLNEEIALQSRRRGSRQGLIEALYSKGMLQLEYDASLTRTAAQAFEARRGNCLSLVLMTSAFAKALDLPLRYQSVYVDELWSRSGDLYFVSGHVNLSLGRSLMDRSGKAPEADLLTIDFIPPDQLRGQRSRVIDEATVVAMYMNNRAAEQLQLGLVDEAYWWARGAVTSDPRFTAAYNTLGVIYRRHGRAELAEEVFRAVLAEEPGNAQVLSNLILVLKERGLLAEVELMNARLRDIQPSPPFKFFDEGVLAMKAGDYKSAKRLFTREMDRFAYFHEIHFWLALANYGLGDLSEARKHLALARDNSPTVKDRQMYTAKLDSLRPVRMIQ